MVDINILEKSFHNKTLLKELKISIKDGEFVSFIGPSGCGKSTLLNIVSGLDEQFQGEVKRDLKNLSFMFQDDRLLPWLTIKENLLLISKSKEIEEIERLLELTNLKIDLDEFPNRLSGGMKRRVSLVRSFINSPKLILLDEPFTSLDYPTSMELKRKFLDLSKTFNPTTILVTHDISEGILLSDRIIFLGKEPTEVILDFKNPNNQSFDTKKVDEIKNTLFEKYPKILEGVV